MCSTSSCWISFLVALVCNASLVSGLYLGNSGDAYGPKNVGWRRDPGGPFLSDPVNLIIIEDRDAMEPPSSSYSYERSWSANQPIVRDVWDPKITSPGASAVWKRGSIVTVTWNTNDAPQHPTNTQGTIYLGHMQDGETNEHLDIEHPLAQGFDLSKGIVQVKVPDVSPGANYIVVLMGDSGNRSPKFTIQ